MRIAIMMRPIDQNSGFHMYVDGLVEAMLKIAPENHYLLLYRTEKYLGRFAFHKSVTEKLVKAPNKLFWDQIVIPFVAWKEKVDVIFNPKFNVPLISHCPVTMGLQEPGYWVEPQYYEKFDVLYQKLMIPIYVRKAAYVFPMANFILEESRKYINYHFKNAIVTYPAPQKHLKPVADKNILKQFKIKYNLPEKFILSITRADNPGMENSRKWNPCKNPITTLRSFLLLKNKISHSLVIAGRNIKNYYLESGFTEKDFERVHFINFIPFEELQNIYSLAELIVVPPTYEGFGFTLLGALACGCPAVASKTGTCPEVVGDAALLADPFSPEDFAEKILMLINDNNLKENLREKGLKRAHSLSWEKAAELTLKGLYKAVKKKKKY